MSEKISPRPETVAQFSPNHLQAREWVRWEESVVQKLAHLDNVETLADLIRGTNLRAGNATRLKDEYWYKVLYNLKYRLFIRSLVLRQFGADIKIGRKIENEEDDQQDLLLLVLGTKPNPLVTETHAYNLYNLIGEDSTKVLIGTFDELDPEIGEKNKRHRIYFANHAANYLRKSA